MRRFVVDASVAIKWLVAEPETQHAMELAGRSRLIAPDLLICECANVLCTKIRAKEFDLSLVNETADVLLHAGVALFPTVPLFASAIAIATRLQHPAYDCFYLALAQAEGCALVTADQRFLRAVAALGDAVDKAACLPLAEAAKL